VCCLYKMEGDGSEAKNDENLVRWGLNEMMTSIKEKGKQRGSVGVCHGAGQRPERGKVIAQEQVSKDGTVFRGC
jgi:hypothetical protein